MGASERKTKCESKSKRKRAGERERERESKKVISFDCFWTRSAMSQRGSPTFKNLDLGASSNKVITLDGF